MNPLLTLTQNRPRTLLVLALLLATGLSLWSQWPGISDPYALQDDFRNFYWMHRFQDPTLFPNDPLIGGLIVDVQLGSLDLIVDISRPGYSLLFYAGSLFFDIVTLHKLLVFPLMLVSVYYLFRIGERLRGSGTGFALAMAFAVLNLASFSSISVAGGLPRSFAAPLLLGLVYYLMVDRTIPALIFLIVSSTIYVPIFLLGAVTYGLAALEPAASKWRFRVRWRRITPLLVLFIAAALLLAPLVAGRLDNLIGALGDEADGSAIVADPGFGSGGRWNLFIVFPFLGLGGLFSKAGSVWQSFSLVFLSLALWIQMPRAVGKYPGALKNLFIASLLMFGLAWFFILVFTSLTLYFPSRYTRISLFLVFLIFAVTNLEEGVNIAVKRLRLLGARQKGLILLLLFVIGAAMVVAANERSFTILRRMWGRDYTYTFIAATLLLVSSILITLFSAKESGFTPPANIPAPVWIALGVVLLSASIFLIPRNREDFKFSNPTGRKVLTAIEKLPVDVIISGEPGWLSQVPLLARRMVLRSSERFGSGTDAAMLATLEAYFAGSFDEVVDFCQAYGVDYMVAAPWTLNEEHIRHGQLFFEPYNSLVRAKIADQTHFALMDIPEEAQLVNAEGLIVFHCTAEVLSGDSG